jgi:hypothetical protein
MSEAPEPQTQATTAPKQPPSVPAAPIGQNTAINPNTPLFNTPKMDAAIKEAQNEAKER